jgi:hypothetical protein
MVIQMTVGDVGNWYIYTVSCPTIRFKSQQCCASQGTKRKENERLAVVARL